MTTLRYLPALGKALRDEMERDADLFVVGEDVRQSLRGVTKGLADEFGDDRVLEGPILLGILQRLDDGLGGESVPEGVAP